MRNEVDASFSAQERAAVYRVIRERRDVRSDFINTPISDEVLGRILLAAHQAPSVGFMQPWDFVLIRDISARKRVHTHVQSMKDAANIYKGKRKALYGALKLEGILEAPLNICITCDRDRAKGHGLGRRTDAMADLYSTACAIQNLWLAARAESVGVGWVSILEFDTVKQILGIPKHIQIVAYLCVGYVSQFRPKPELETAGWETRTALAELVHFDAWGNRDKTRATSVVTG
jgi:5,6-dimethylbenzimidazole synthase